MTRSAPTPCRPRTASASCCADALKVGDALYLAVYDNRALENRLQRYAWDDLALQAEWVLPSLEDPAGYTYEMEPPIRLLTTPDGVLHVVGGTLHAMVQHDEIVDTRLVGCIKALEAVVGTDTSVAVLCENGEGRFAPSVSGRDPAQSELLDTCGVPYGLSYDAVGLVPMVGFCRHWHRGAVCVRDLERPEQRHPGTRDEQP